MPGFRPEMVALCSAMVLKTGSTSGFFSLPSVRETTESLEVASTTSPLATSAPSGANCTDWPVMPFWVTQLSMASFSLPPTCRITPSGVFSGSVNGLWKLSAMYSLVTSRCSAEAAGTRMPETVTAAAVASASERERITVKLFQCGVSDD